MLGYYFIGCRCWMFMVRKLCASGNRLMVNQHNGGDILRELLFAVVVAIAILGVIIVVVYCYYRC